MKQTMLIADGDAELCDIYQNCVNGHGYDVETSSDGMDCMRKLRRLTPDVLVLDLELLWGGGDGVLGWLRDEPKYLPSSSLASPPVVTALAKPFHLSALLDDPALAVSNGAKHSPNGVRRRGILVADDEPAVRDILQRHLQSQGFHVWTAANGEEALDHCCNHCDEIAVILLDVQMSGLDGPQTLDGIRQLEFDIPVCFMTGDPGEYEPGDLLRQGARHLFRKPFRLDEIVRVVSNLANDPMAWPQEN